MDQNVFNIAIGIAGALGGWWNRQPAGRLPARPEDRTNPRVVSTGLHDAKFAHRE